MNEYTMKHGGKKETPKVSVVCITYNHELLISDALQSFVNQKTNFHFEIIVGEDKSTDNTLAVLKSWQKNYPDLIRIISGPQNVGMMKNFIRSMRAARGEYIALCEGDDFWTSPDKLQTQLDYIQQHPDSSLLFHATEVVKSNSKTKMGRVIRAAQGNVMISDENLLECLTYLAPTASLFFPRKFIKNLPSWIIEAPVGDLPLKLYLSQKGSVYYLDTVMATRRLEVKDSWTSRMRKDSTAYSKHSQSMIDTLDNFDRFSHYKYHQHIQWKKSWLLARQMIFGPSFEPKKLRSLLSPLLRHPQVTTSKRIEIAFAYFAPKMYRFMRTSEIMYTLKTRFLYKKW